MIIVKDIILSHIASSPYRAEEVRNKIEKEIKNLKGDQNLTISFEGIISVNHLFIKIALTDVYAKSTYRKVMENANILGLSEENLKTYEYQKSVS